MFKLFNPNVIAIDIGSKHTKIVFGKVHKDVIKIQTARTLDTPIECISDGNITDFKIIARTINVALNEMGLKEKKVSFTSNSTAIITRDLMLPLTNPNEMYSLVKFQMEKYLPIKFDQYILQYSIVDTIEEEDVKKALINVVVYPKHMEENYSAIAKRIRCTPKALDFNANCVNKLFLKNIIVNDEAYNSEETVALIDLGHEYTNVTILSKGKLEFTRVMEKGLANIDMELSHDLEISLEKAKDLREKYFDLSLVEQDLDTSTEAGMVNATCHREFKGITEDVVRIFQYFRNKSNGKNVERIFIFGGAANLKKIDKFFERNTSITTTKINSMSNIKFNSKEELGNYLNAIGALVRL